MESLQQKINGIDYKEVFNNKYGFARGDKVPLFTARTLQDALDNHGRGDDCQRHIGSDFFVIVIPCKYSYQIAENIIETFKNGILKFYNNEDTDKKCIQSIDRKGIPQTFPIMSSSIAGIDLSHRRYSSYIEVNDICIEIKKRAKSKEGSCFYLDQRTP